MQSLEWRCFNKHIVFIQNKHDCVIYGNKIPNLTKNDTHFPSSADTSSISKMGKKHTGNANERVLNTAELNTLKLVWRNTNLERKKYFMTLQTFECHVQKQSIFKGIT